ncbi:rod shape-determining protein MreC [Candidatus Omnitrophus magneticus]|uniref:Cell shape-determining protein MreC n=1 Tax=Candidatus Omnitrophus magneticus TaxID=1609969 RepID=A0A0F0CRI7_9BACT|nr:rod shape-determining protein MreC [Candidatus Omnitrophus magneticus]
MPTRILFNNKLIFTIIACLSIIAMLYIFPSSISNFRNLTIKFVSSPFYFYKTVTNYFLSKGLLLKENSELKNKIIELNLEIEQLKTMNEENIRLKNMLDLRKDIGFYTISSRIIARDPNSWNNVCIIDKGKNDGIVENSAVLSHKGLIGKVIETHTSTSFVILLTHPAFRVGGFIEKNKAHGVIYGTGEGLLRMEYLPIDSEIEKGSIVSTSGLSRIFPKGLAIGKIISARKSKTGLYKYALIEPSIGFFDSEEVLCVSPKNSQSDYPPKKMDKTTYAEL